MTLLLMKDAELQHLKRVSRIKHLILQNYFPPWASILGSGSSLLAYCDCFAGPGQYEYLGQRVLGSPLIAVKAGIDFLKGKPERSLNVYLIEDDPDQVEKLQTGLTGLEPFPPRLKVELIQAASALTVPELLKGLPPHSPSFFLVDPYGHPLSIPVLNDILQRDRTEVLINLMWYRVNMDLSNPLMGLRLTELFGDDDWRTQSFNRLSGSEREREFLRYFRSRLKCKYVLPFKIRYDPEDTRGGDRTKYYLLHGSNHVKAVLLMKEVMWPLGDEEGTFDYSGDSQGILISMSPKEEELTSVLLRQFAGRTIEFDELRKETWELPFVEKQYRSTLKALEGRTLEIKRITSKKTGLKGKDRLLFK